MSELIKCLYEDIDDAGKDCNNNIDGKCIQRCIGRLCKKNKKLEDLAVEFSKENEVIREQLSKEIEHHIKTRTKLRKENEELRDKAIGECVNVIPTTWLDPLLSGKTKIMIPPYNCNDIENLLAAVKERMLELKGGERGR